MMKSPIACLPDAVWPHVCYLGLMDPADMNARLCASDAANSGALQGCVTVTDYAAAILSYRLKYLSAITEDPPEPTYPPRRPIMRQY